MSEAKIACNVVACGYVADGVIAECGDFPVCALHDSVITRRILEQFRRPISYWGICGRPGVFPGAPLQEQDLAPVQAKPDAGHVFDAEWLAFKPVSTVPAMFDLTLSDPPAMRVQ